MAQNTLPPLDKVDPTKAWLPWKPSTKDPWNLKWAGHLYRRAAFGAHLIDLRKTVESGLPATLDRLFKGESKPGADLHNIVLTGKAAAAEGDPYSLRGWWLYWMMQSGHPLREKMTLFWHNHFATSIAKVKQPQLMYYQNKLLREHALGKFEPFLQEMSKDPAMLIWLDSNSNVKGKPNENYARELMELFSLGVGNYGEKDVLEAARAFTGWHTTSDGPDARFEFAGRLHDDGEKTVLDKTGKWNGDDIVRICLQQPVCAQFIVRKLYRFLISETATPPDALLDPLANQFRKSDYDISALVRTILSSRHFFSGYAYRQRIKSPVEFVLGAAFDVAPGAAQPRALVGKVDVLGQELFAPPNVKGWEGGRAWLNTAVVLARHNFSQTLTSGSGRINLGDNPGRAPSIAPVVDPVFIIRREKPETPEKTLALILDLLLQGDLNESARTKLLAYLKEGDLQGNALDTRIRETFHAIMTMPEYQLA